MKWLLGRLLSWMRPDLVVGCSRAGRLSEAVVRGEHRSAYGQFDSLSPFLVRDAGQAICIAPLPRRAALPRSGEARKRSAP